MLHSSRFEEIRDYWKNGKWSLLWVRQELQAGHITKEEYEEIIGKKYKSDTYYEYHSKGVPIQLI